MGDDEAYIMDLIAENRKLQAKLDVAIKGLERVRDQDYRGNRCSCSNIAFKTLSDIEKGG